MVTRDLSAVAVLPSDAIDGNVYAYVHVPSCLLVLGTEQLGRLSCMLSLCCICISLMHTVIRSPRAVCFLFKCMFVIFDASIIFYSHQ